MARKTFQCMKCKHRHSYKSRAGIDHLEHAKEGFVMAVRRAFLAFNIKFPQEFVSQEELKDILAKNLEK